MYAAVLGIVAGVVATVYAMTKLSDAIALLIRSWIPVVLAARDLCRAVRGSQNDHDEPDERGRDAIKP